MAKKYERKVLSFSTTMRNPVRMADFLFVMLDYENHILTGEVIMKIVKNVLYSKLYCPTYINNDTRLAKLYKNEYEFFSEEDLELIIENSKQNHKEKGFNEGWESRFDTWYKLISEFGFCYYSKNQPILISNSGKMLIESCYNIGTKERKEYIDETLMSSVFLNSLSKYEVGNPYKKNLNHNTPFRLLLALLNRLNSSKMSSLSVKEIPILLCWRDNNVDALFNYIIKLREEIFALNKVHFSYSNEFIYRKCLKLLESENTVRFKIGQITVEAVDEYIRKIRITGLVSLRGAGRFIDINHNEMEKVNYILSNQTAFQGNYLDDSDLSRLSFYNYMSIVDYDLIDRTSEDTPVAIKIEKLKEFATTYTSEEIEKELIITCTNRQQSNNDLFKYIDKPLRFEFLTSIFLRQNFIDLHVMPNYKCDDEGIPTFTAIGGMSDIVVSDDCNESYVEVSLIRDRKQTTNEMIPIERHLKDYIANSDNRKDKFSIFVAPIIHSDTVRFAQFAKYKDNLDILFYNINDFIVKVKESNEIGDLNIQSLLH